MSGFLLGGGEKRKDSQWLFSRFRRILIDYWIYIICIIFIYYFSKEEILTYQQIIGLLCAKTTLPGIEHFWFIRTLLICYIHVAIFDYIIGKMPSCRIKKLFTL